MRYLIRGFPKDPQPPERWEGIRDATKEGGVCFQYDIMTNTVVGGEDCLFLNVFTPQVNNSEIKNAIQPPFYIIRLATTKKL